MPRARRRALGERAGNPNPNPNPNPNRNPNPNPNRNPNPNPNRNPNPNPNPNPNQDGLALQLLSAGRDGVLHVSSVVTPYSTEGMPVTPPQPRTISWPAAEDEAASGAEGGDDDELTVLEAPAAGAVAVAAGGVQSAATQALLGQREVLRERLLGLIATNGAMEEGDPEKLEADAFIIDLEQQAAWRKDGDARVATLRAQTEKDNLGKELLTDRYRVEFWESMATKVRARVRVSPYPLTLTSNPNPNL